AEVAGITRCQFLRASEIISADDMLWAVLDALNLKSRLWKFGRETARETRRESFEHRQHKPRGGTAMTCHATYLGPGHTVFRCDYVDHHLGIHSFQQPVEFC